MTAQKRKYTRDVEGGYGVLPQPSHQFDDHVRAWRLAQRAKAEGFDSFRFAREQCQEWGIRLDSLYPRNGGQQTCELRYVLINRLKQVYPHLSTPQIGRVVKKSHGVVLFTLGRLGRKPTPMNGGRKKQRRATKSAQQ